MNSFNSFSARLQFPGRLGLGAWMMGELRVFHAREVAALTHAQACSRKATSLT